MMILVHARIDTCVRSLYLLISNKDISLTTVAQSLQGHWDCSAFLHLRTKNFFVDDKTIYSWCELIEYIFTACCKSPLELNIWPTVNSPIGCPIKVFPYGVQSLDTTWPMFSTFSNYGDGAKWYCIGDNSIGSSKSSLSGLFDKLHPPPSTATYIICSLSIASRTGKKGKLPFLS